MARKPDHAAPTTNQRLISIVERIERLLEEKKALSEDIADIKQEAKSAGFEVKVINQMIRERAMSEAEREDYLALAEIYRAALGMLNGTPLGEAARKRFEPPAPPPPAGEKPGAPAPTADARAAPKADAFEPEESPPAAGPTEADTAQARIEGGQAFLAGLPVTRNPWPANDIRRSEWDMGWCALAGSDGMEIPAAWRRKPKQSGQPGATP
jgi:uncharacterized protein (UPF0335 family)